MRRLLNPLTHNIARPQLRSPLFQASQVRSFATKRGPKKGSKKAAAAAAAAEPAPAAASTPASGGAIPEIPASHASSLTGYTGVAARALWRSAAEKGAQSLASVEQEVANLTSFLSTPSEADIKEFAQVVNKEGKVKLADFVVGKEIAMVRRQALERHVRRAIREAARQEGDPVDAEPIDERFQFSPVLESMLVEVMEKKRFKKLEVIFKEFQDVMDAYKGITRALVTVAQPLTKEQDALVRKFLAVECGNNTEVVLSVTVDQSLIAGMQIQVGEKMWNMAASHHLNKSKKSLQASMTGREWSYDKGRMFA